MLQVIGVDFINTRIPEVLQDAADPPHFSLPRSCVLDFEVILYIAVHEFVETNPSQLSFRHGELQSLSTSGGRGDQLYAGGDCIDEGRIFSGIATTITAPVRSNLIK